VLWSGREGIGFPQNLDRLKTERLIRDWCAKGYWWVVARDRVIAGVMLVLPPEIAEEYGDNRGVDVVFYIVVLPDYQRCGIAEHLLAHAQGVAAALDAKTGRSNEPVHRLLRKAGFELAEQPSSVEKGDWVHYRWTRRGASELTRI
jgi:GNAT superfamily N-acetyltransferase